MLMRQNINNDVSMNMHIELLLLAKFAFLRINLIED